MTMYNVGSKERTMVGTITENNEAEIKQVYGNDVWAACVEATETDTFLGILIKLDKI